MSLTGHQIRRRKEAAKKQDQVAEKPAEKMQTPVAKKKAAKKKK